MSAIATASKQLKNLLEGVEYTITGNIDKTEITGLSADSRVVEPGDLFAALQGFSVDGHNYVDQAVAAGCSALLVDQDWQGLKAETKISPEIPFVKVADTKVALGNIAAAFYDHPDRHLKVIGLTGTNGKTTTSFLVEALLKACGKRTGVIGTVSYRYTDKNGNAIEMEAPFTTPESHILFALLRQMADEEITDVIMEVSSHALAQARLTGMAFDIAVFTNLSRDHLDFHSDMHHYFASKKLLFTEHLKPHGRVVLMLDETALPTAADTPSGNEINDWGKRMRQELTAMYQAQKDSPAILTCGLSSDCDVHPQDFTIDIHGIKAAIKSPAGKLSVETPLVGEFNLRNLLCAIGIGIAHHEELGCVQKGIESLRSIPGRLEKIIPAKADSGGPAVFVDYAHTPDALENVLKALLALHPERLVCVFGCGGDRDPGKRHLMGEIAGILSDVVLATSDNPRSESPVLILEQIEEGLVRSGLEKLAAAKILSEQKGKGFDIITSRRLAISTAIHFARPGDVILISGKGHENYQISSKGKIFFDDRIEAEMQMQAAAGHKHAWKLGWLQQITGARLLSPADKSAIFKSISTDSRTIQPGDLYVALQGENFDGNIFAQKAAENGAAGLLLSRRPEQGVAELDFEPAIPVLLVPDTLYAFGEIAGSVRRWNRGLKVVAITGSSGKTTVKEITGAILSQTHTILKTEGNFNNLVGLPLTLLELQPEHEIAVLEMGMNRPGEIARLTEIADPDIACIINVQEAHLEGLGDIWGVAQAKNELFAGQRPEGKVAVNLDDEIVSSLADRLPQEKITFGCHADAFVRATDIKSQGEAGMAFTLHIGRENRPVTVKGLGRHNVTNSLAAAAMAYGLGIGIAEISTGLSIFMPYDKRACVEKLPSGVRVFNDCYNANPASMLAALNTLKELKKDHRTLAVLGDMLELGSKSIAAHRNLGQKVFDLEIDFLAAYGSWAHDMVESACQAGMDQAAARAFSSKQDLVDWLEELMQNGSLNPGDWLLIKGSRGMRMEEILELLDNKPNINKAAGN